MCPKTETWAPVALAGEFFVIVGPSGCGKTSTLRMIAGLEDITGGTIAIGERVVNDIAPRDRDVAMVFQNYALFPHKTIFNNVAFGLKYRDVAKNEVEDKVKKALEMVLTGSKLTAREALDMGLITRMVPRESLDAEVSELLETLGAKSPIGMKIGKAAFHAMADMPFEEAVDYLAGKLTEVAGTEDAREGIMAFLEKRRPVFNQRPQ